VTYQLGFYPENIALDGSFHKLQVKVNRRDAQVQAREGYYALDQVNLTPEMVRSLIAQTAHSLVNATGIRFSVRVAPAASDKTRLTLSLSVDPSQFSFAVRDGELIDGVDVAFVAMDSTNHVLQTSVAALPFKLDAETYNSLLKSGLPVMRDATIPPDASALQVIVYDEGNSQVGSVRIPLASYTAK
jgi:hypothetical protein